MNRDLYEIAPPEEYVTESMWKKKDILLMGLGAMFTAFSAIDSNPELIDLYDVSPIAAVTLMANPRLLELYQEDPEAAIELIIQGLEQ